MKKIWGILCVVGFTAFWVYVLSIAAALFGERLFHPTEILFCLLGLAVGLAARWQILRLTPAMHGRRASSRKRLEEEYFENAHG